MNAVLRCRVQGTGCRVQGSGRGEPRTLYPDPRSYTPKHLADKILQSKSALEGERKQVTVLFADVKGSMELASQVDPEEWHNILDRFFEILSDGVHRFEGSVNQYTGDGIMALFGAPIAYEDHTRRACYAALHLLDGLRTYANELRLRRGLNFSARLGINSGEVIVGKIGDDLRMDYTAQGHTVGLAARMEQMTSSAKTARYLIQSCSLNGLDLLCDRRRHLRRRRIDRRRTGTVPGGGDFESEYLYLHTATSSPVNPRTLRYATALTAAAARAHRWSPEQDSRRAL
jgi:class 3 adenylate cyclase